MDKPGYSKRVRYEAKLLASTIIPVVSRKYSNQDALLFLRELKSWVNTEIARRNGRKLRKNS